MSSAERVQAGRWVGAVTVIFVVVGLGFGTWLSRIPAIRDELGATPSEMSVYGLCLAVGSVAGLAISGRLIERFGPRRTLAVFAVLAALALPAAAAIILAGALPAGLAVLFGYGFAFSVCDVAMNVSGANAERALGRPRMPLMHGGYSLGAVAATGIGAAAEAAGVPVPLHFLAVMVGGAVVLLALLPALPRDERAARIAAERRRGAPASGCGASGTDEGASAGAAGGPGAPEAPEGEVPASAAAAGAGPARASTPWRDPRIVVIGVMTLSFGLFEGTASDWLPLALVDGHGVSNQLGAAMLSVFFAAVMLVRLIGSPLILRFGRSGVLRASAALAMAGVVVTILAPGTPLVIVGVVLWGVGTSLGWPTGISAAADRVETAARDVAAVSALGYGSMLLGPMAFGFLGEHVGLLTAFWALLPFGVYVVFAAASARQRSAGAGH
ncbi:hypothetical protein B4915_01670 [Leucobacter massiliensis]|uniref:Major facilitator superfamily (MFS) profile domain-containing protein n=1 Tax=Leucobacter massiliensis TaxID=1686285 RepID=A0A2S9QS40_9MICO|nr:hypothetical protein B4915_01670 [Leucobacter massiliensis]